MTALSAPALTRRVASTIGVTSSAAALAMLAQIYAARVLGAVEYGYYSYALAWVMTIATLAKLGLDTTALRVLPACAASHSWGAHRAFAQFSSRWVGAASVGLAGLMLLVVAALSGREQPMTTALLFAAPLVLLLAFVDMRLSWLQALRRNVEAQLAAGVARPLLLIALLAGAAITGRRVTAALLIACTACILGMVLVALLSMSRRFWPERSRTAAPEYNAKAWWSIAIPLFAIAISQMLLARADVLIVGSFLSPAAVGIYAVANQLATLVTFGISTTNSVTAPLISEYHAGRDRVALRTALKQTSRLALAVTAPACAVLVVFGPMILGFFGEGFSAGYWALLLLSSGQLVIAVCGPVGFLLTMTEHQNTALWVICGAALLQIALVSVLTPAFGMVGAAAGAALANASRSLVLTWIVRRKLGLNATAF